MNVALMLLAQSALGNLHAQMGLLFAAFMLGLALGGFCLSCFFCGRERVVLALLLASAAASVLLCGQAGRLLTQGLVVFLVLQAGIGFLVGGVFPAAAEMGETHGARLYGADLWGACLGGAACASLFIPVWGFQAAMSAAAVPGGAVVLWRVTAWPERRRSR